MTTLQAASPHLRRDTAPATTRPVRSSSPCSRAPSSSWRTSRASSAPARSRFPCGLSYGEGTTSSGVVRIIDSSATSPGATCSSSRTHRHGQHPVLPGARIWATAGRAAAHLHAAHKPPAAPSTCPSLHRLRYPRPLVVGYGLDFAENIAICVYRRAEAGVL